MPGPTPRQKSAMKLAESSLVLTLAVFALVYQADMNIKFKHMRTALGSLDATLWHQPFLTNGTAKPLYDEIIGASEGTINGTYYDTAHRVMYEACDQAPPVDETFARASVDKCRESAFTKETKRLLDEVSRVYDYTMWAILFFFLPTLLTLLAYVVSTAMNGTGDGADWTKPTFLSGFPLHIVTMSHILGFFVWLSILSVGLSNDYFKTEWYTTVVSGPAAEYVKDNMDQQDVYVHFVHNFVRVFILNALVFAGHLTVHFSEPSDLSRLIGAVTGANKMGAKAGAQTAAAARVASTLRAVTVSKMV